MEPTIDSRPDYNQLVLADRVNGRIYYDPAIFRDELDKIWHREWVYVAHESEVPEPGDYVTRLIGAQPVIVSRDDAGRVNLLLNRCTHRGNTICQSLRGNSHAFRCAYHGWTFNSSGDLVGVPYAAGYDKSFRKDEFALAKVPRTGSYRGLIFASLSAEGPPLEDRLGAARALLDQFVNLAPDGELIVRSGVLKHSYRGNWKMALENSVDGYHPNILHHAAMVMMTRGKADMESLFGERSDAQARDLGNGTAQLDLNVLQNRNGGRVVPPTWSKSAHEEFRAALAKRHGAERADRILAEGGPHFCIFPNLILILNQLRVIQPVSVDETVIYYYPTLLKGAPDEVNQRRLSETYLVHGPAGRVAPDDFEAYERNQMGFEARVNEWLVLRRGLHREEHEAGGSIAGHETDETTQRGIWNYYRELMTH
ncbi:MAG TPA: aromatic ring-hydroxylating dioxygenase subunit alpha [Candidatus Binataceae bacterium]|jgi:phenylpropionate dioxygenase-like ring-hydroxylating dioxygenase large terminal subunit|nr:aromatic ring-hydroxylating dioxygenase subunit alpha [Candidatus Binataceae bacterium]